MEKYKKYITHIIPFIIMVISIVASVLSMYNNPAIEYEYDSKLEGYVVKEARGNISSYTIPATINDVPVVGIGIRAFYGHSRLEEVNFAEPQNIKYIERLAFSECEKLKTIDLRYVEEIGRNAFAYDKSLNNIEINTRYLLSSTFFKCESLTNITLGEGVQSIGTYAFAHTAISELRLPRSIKNIYVDALDYMNLNKLYVPIGFFSSNLDEFDSVIEKY